MKPPDHTSIPDRVSGPGMVVESHGGGTLSRRVQPVSKAFRNILLVVLLIFVFAVVQMFSLWRVCNTGMETAASLKQKGLPTLNLLASLQEDIAIYRLHSYEYLFAAEEAKAGTANAVTTVASRLRSELDGLKFLLPVGEGRDLVARLTQAFADLDAGFWKVRGLVDGDFPAAMKAMDQEIPPLTRAVADAASSLASYGYGFSGGQANATFWSFGWIQKNAVIFGIGNIVVVFGAVVFVIVAARRSSAQLAEMLARLDERTHELANSLSLVHATLEATADGIVLIDESGRIGNYNQQFVSMWGIPEASIMENGERLLAFKLTLLKQGECFAAKVRGLAADPATDTFDVLALHDGRVFECYSKPHRVEERICGRVWSFRDVTERKLAEAKLEAVHRQLLDVSRQAGMAEVATSVLHNVGNVLNSVNVSTTLVMESVRKSKVSHLGRVVALLETHAADLGAFVTTHAQGKNLPGYLHQLHERLGEEQRVLLAEVAALQGSVDHIKEIVAMQQEYARVSGVTEVLKVTDLVEDSLRMNAAALGRHGVRIERDYRDEPVVALEKHKALQVLVNLIRNAKYACDDGGHADKRVTLRVIGGTDFIRIEVADNGVGIPAENMTRIFNHGFTTRKEGHGFGLHSGANTAREMGGNLTAHSDGPGLGATFTFEIPATAPSTPYV